MSALSAGLVALLDLLGDVGLTSSDGVWTLDRIHLPDRGAVVELSRELGAVIVVRVPSEAYPGRWRTLYEARP
jgi:hypothetical protein